MLLGNATRTSCTVNKYLSHGHRQSPTVTLGQTFQRLEGRKNADSSGSEVVGPADLRDFPSFPQIEPEASRKVDAHPGAPRAGCDAIISLFSLGVGTVLGQLSPKPTMYRSQQVRIRGLKNDLGTVR